MSKLGKRLIQAAKEAVAFARGELDPATFQVHTAEDIMKRRRNEMDDEEPKEPSE